MKKLILLFVITFSPLMAFAQGSLSDVTLKNGTVLRGTIKSIDPTKSLIIVIAGVETAIEMSDIATVEEVSQTVSTMPVAPTTEEDKLIVTDNTPYPESFDMKVGNQTVKMVLVRGGVINMGYNGRHSLKYKSEPMHKVKVTSFYISNEYVKSSIVSEVEKGVTPKKDSYYSTNYFKKMKGVIEAISQFTNLPVRMPTEAEWEYAACSDKQSVIFGKCNDYEFCSDWFSEFDKNDNLTDPTGPLKGKYHVFRSYSKFESKFDRSSLNPYEYSLNKYVRLVIKAKDMNHKNSF